MRCDSCGTTLMEEDVREGRAQRFIIFDPAKKIPTSHTELLCNSCLKEPIAL